VKMHAVKVEPPRESQVHPRITGRPSSEGLAVYLSDKRPILFYTVASGHPDEDSGLLHEEF
jgi:hypothetical protein